MAQSKIIHMLALIKDGKIGKTIDEWGNMVRLNYTGAATGIKYSKYIGGNIVVGATMEELEADEKALREFIKEYQNDDPMHLYRVAEVLNKEHLSEEDIAYLDDELKSYVDSHKEIVTRTETVHSSEPTTGRNKYPGLMEGLYALDDVTLKTIKNEANRKGQKDLYNACRKVLRAHGINC